MSDRATFELDMENALDRAMEKLVRLEDAAFHWARLRARFNDPEDQPSWNELAEAESRLAHAAFECAGETSD